MNRRRFMAACVSIPSVIGGPDIEALKAAERAAHPLYILRVPPSDDDMRRWLASLDMNLFVMPPDAQVEIIIGGESTS